MAAGDLDIGTLSGRVEIEDNSSVSLANISGKVDLLAQKFDQLGTRTQSAKESQDAMGDALDAVSQRFERVTERVAEYFAVREVASFISDIGESALALDNLSKQTDISVGDLQVLGTATAEYGLDSDQLGRAVFQLSQRLAGGDQSASTALHMMGLSLAEVQGLNGKDLFLTIESGLATLQGTAQDVAAADLFGGRIGKSMIAFANNSDEALARAQALGSYMGNDAVKQLADYARNVDLAENNLKNLAGQALGPVAQGFNNLFNVAGNVGIWNTLKAVWIDEGAALTGLGTGTEAVTSLMSKMNQGQTESAAAAKAAAAAHGDVTEKLTAEGQAAKFMAALEADAGKELTDWQIQDLQHLQEIGELNTKNAAAIGVNSAQLDKYKESVKATAEEQKKFADAITQMNSVGASWEDTLNMIDGTTVEAVKYYIQQGVSLKDLATAYGLTDAQVKAINDDEKAEVEGRKTLITLTEQEAKAESDLVKVRIDLAQNSLKSQEQVDLQYWADRYAKGTASEQQYGAAIMNIKTAYAQQSEALYQQAEQNQLQAVDDGMNKQLADLKAKYDQGKLDFQDYQDAQTLIEQTAADKREGIEEQYQAARKQRQLQTDADITQSMNQLGTNTTHVYSTMTEAMDAMEAGLDASKIKVQQLDGSVVSLQDAIDKLHMGGSVDVSSQNFGSVLQSYFTAGGLNLSNGIDINYATTLAHQGYSFAEIVQILQNNQNGATGPLPSPQGPRIPGFAQGGVGDFGDGTLAMLHGKEAIVPLGAAGVSGIGNNSITNNFNIAGADERSARTMANIIMRQLKQQRQFS